MKSFLHIAMLTHSTNPRGGVVHAMALSDALSDLGYDLTLFAPDSRGTGFFRQTRCSAVGIPVGPASLDITAMVEQRIAEYVDYFAQAGTQDFDLFHAHDGISGNALATLKERGLINGFVRTVHHIDSFVDPDSDGPAGTIDTQRGCTFFRQPKVASGAAIQLWNSGRSCRQWRRPGALFSDSEPQRPRTSQAAWSRAGTSLFERWRSRRAQEHPEHS